MSDILSLLRKRIETIKVGELTLFIRQLSARDNVKLYTQQNSFPEGTNNVEHVLLIISYMLCDEEGKLLFTPGSQEAVDTINDFPPEVFKKLCAECVNLTAPPKYDEVKKN